MSNKQKKSSISSLALLALLLFQYQYPLTLHATESNESRANVAQDNRSLLGNDELEHHQPSKYQSVFDNNDDDDAKQDRTDDPSRGEIGNPSEEEKPPKQDGETNLSEKVPFSKRVQAIFCVGLLVNNLSRIFIPIAIIVGYTSSYTLKEDTTENVIRKFTRPSDYLTGIASTYSWKTDLLLSVLIILPITYYIYTGKSENKNSKRQNRNSYNNRYKGIGGVMNYTSDIWHNRSKSEGAASQIAKKNRKVNKENSKKGFFLNIISNIVTAYFVIYATLFLISAYHEYPFIGAEEIRAADQENNQNQKDNQKNKKGKVVRHIPWYKWLSKRIRDSKKGKENKTSKKKLEDNKEK